MCGPLIKEETHRVSGDGPHGVWGGATALHVGVLAPEVDPLKPGNKDLGSEGLGGRGGVSKLTAFFPETS